MPKIKEFFGYLVNPSQAERVITPAYDGMLPSDRRVFANEHPYNYVNVMRSLEEFGGDGPTLKEILDFNKSSLDRLLTNGSFQETQAPAYYLYSLNEGGHEQIGVIAEIPVTDYTTGRLKKHEDTQLEKESMLTRYHEAVGATSSPVCVAYPDDGEITKIVNQVVQSEPYLRLNAWDDVLQTVWRIDDPELSAKLEARFEEIEYTYLTDGHHRCASGARYAHIVNARTSVQQDEDSKSNYLLVALFPQSHMRIYSYFRCVRDLNGKSPEQLVAAIKDAGFLVEPISREDTANLLPKGSKVITMLLEHSAYCITIPSEMILREDNPVDSLDVSILQNKILAPILGIDDARSDKRLSYVPGVEGGEGLIAHCDENWPICFACADTKIEEVIEVADAGEVMPPKSTWFDPKLRAGIFLRPV